MAVAFLQPTLTTMELNIYGVNKTATDMWVKVVTPLELAWLFTTTYDNN